MSGQTERMPVMLPPVQDAGELAIWLQRMWRVVESLRKRCTELEERIRILEEQEEE